MNADEDARETLTVGSLFSGVGLLDYGLHLAGMALNPSFVEWMMGAPDGWSDPDCPLSATEFSSKQDGYADNES